MRGKKRKAKTPPNQAKTCGKLLYAELEAAYCMKTCTYHEVLDRVCYKFIDDIQRFEPYSALSLRASVRLQEVQAAHEQLCSLEWISTNEIFKLPKENHKDFMTTLPMRGQPHGKSAQRCARICIHLK